MERIYYRISQFIKLLFYELYMLKSFFNLRKIVSESDYRNLKTMLMYFESKYPYSTNHPFLLFKAEMERAKKIKDYEMPDNVVKIDSRVTVKNLQTGKNLTVQIVYPNQEKLIKYKLSVFSAVGMVLFAQKSGTTLSYFKGNRKIKLEILSIV